MEQIKKHVSVASAEEILQDISNYEDIDTALLLMPTEHGYISLTEYDGSAWVEGATLREALIKMHKKTVTKWFEEDGSLLDWSGILPPIWERE
jgi:hypothetical protein